MVLDRAGLVGNDGATHHGTFDLAYMGCVPDIVVMAPSDEVELQNMIETMYLIDNQPSVVRFPRGNGYGAEVLKDLLGTETPSTARGTPLQIGQGRIVKSATAGKKYRVAILSIGTRLVESVQAARAVEEQYPDISVTVADARFMKPLDETLITQLATEADVMITIEEGSIGGFGSHVMQFVTDHGLLDNGTLRIRSMVIPDQWIEQGPQKDQYDIAELNEIHIAAKIESLVDGIRNYRARSVLDVKAETVSVATQPRRSYFASKTVKQAPPSFDIA
jgi:1-deoxy-D-xylulose-5-phosphate synthase